MTRTCPTCKGPTAKPNNKFYPFCRERCQMADLGRWLNEEYRIPDSPDGSAASELTRPDDD